MSSVCHAKNTGHIEKHCRWHNRPCFCQRKCLMTRFKHPSYNLELDHFFYSSQPRVPNVTIKLPFAFHLSNGVISEFRESKSESGCQISGNPILVGSQRLIHKMNPSSSETLDITWMEKKKRKKSNKCKDFVSTHADTLTRRSKTHSGEKMLIWINFPRTGKIVKMFF